MKTMTLCMPRLLSRFARDKRGVSAVEFAFLAPLMIAMYLGVVEISDGVAADRKVTLTAGALANLVGQSQTLVTADMTNIFNASTAIIKPYSVGNLTATVSCLKIDAFGQSHRRLECHKRRHGPYGRFWRNDPGRTGNSQYFAGLERSDLRLHADHRLHDYGHAQPHGSDVHEPAPDAAGL